MINENFKLLCCTSIYCIHEQNSYNEQNEQDFETHFFRVERSQEIGLSSLTEAKKLILSFSNSNDESNAICNKKLPEESD